MLRITTSRTEIRDLIKSWLAISIAFGIVILNTPITEILHNPFALLLSTLFAGLSVGISFLLHELAHKIIAQKHKCFAEYRSFDNMLLLSIALSFFGFVFIAPGAVLISGESSKKNEGRIAIAGPLMNIVLAFIFLAIGFFSSGVLHTFSSYGLLINSWIALFNLIPIGMFDGLKIWRQNKAAYISMAVISICLMMSQSLIK